ncbi:MAG: MarR family transcriptional regulator [Anaeroplasmataceae bacterium]|nr:MarR family transcriptional regulator [Anaeroplasmataceae bacterium]
MLNEEIAVKFRIIKNKFFEKMIVPLQKANLTKIEFEILNHIFLLSQKNILVRATDLANDFHVSLPAILHKLDILEQKNYVFRRVDEQDKRIKYYDLTDITSKNYENLYQEYNKKMEDYFKSLGEEKEHLIRILDLTIQFMEDEK